MVPPIPNSSMFAFPTMVTPACFSRSTTVASYGGTYDSSMADPQVVRTPSVLMLSLTATVRPASGPSSAPSIVSRVMNALCAIGVRTPAGP